MPLAPLAPAGLVVVVVVVEVEEVAVVEVEVAEEEMPLAKLQVKRPSHGMDCEAFPHNCSKEIENSSTPS